MTTEIFNNDYDDVKPSGQFTFDSIKEDLKNANDRLVQLANYELLDIPVNDSRHLSLINRFKIPTPDAGLRTHSFIFITRPNLHLISTLADVNGDEEVGNDNNKKLGYSFNGVKELRINPELASIAPFNYVYNMGKDRTKDSSELNIGKKIIYSLMGIATRSNGTTRIEWDDMQSPWLPVYTNRALTYDVKDMSMNTANTGETFHGNAIVYGLPSFEHLIKGTVTITFRDARDLSLFYTTKIWTEYIQAVSIGKASPYRYYISNGILDYASSLYFVTTDETMENVLYWEKLTGIFPITCPDSIFSDAQGTDVKNLEFQITFAYSRRTPLLEAHLEEINRLYFINSDRGNIDISNIKKISESSSSNTTLENMYWDARDSVDNDSIISRYKTMFQNSDTDKLETFLRKYSIIDNSQGSINRNIEFYANYLSDQKMHGIPYVNGPYITLGSAADNGDDTPNNTSQYKLRWI